jgi:hypothetical protein
MAVSLALATISSTETKCSVCDEFSRMVPVQHHETSAASLSGGLAPDVRFRPTWISGNSR